ncbi:hypothetical protein HYT84_01345 [Candidatus Micrarchaeota archaeon]|nr:hypothetical protein [Candidatus Micrarchaeota archaeon]
MLLLKIERIWRIEEKKERGLKRAPLMLVPLISSSLGLGAKLSKIFVFASSFKPYGIRRISG